MTFNGTLVKINMKKPIIILIALVLSSYTFSQSKKGYKLVWQDNFRGQTIDSTNWTHEVAPPGWVNNELQRYTNGENAKIRNGKLIITAKNENNEYTSSRLITRDKRIFTYGIIEIKAKLPKGKGTWPALWMLGNNIDKVNWPACGELDIMEHVGNEPGVVHSSIHNSSGYAATPYSGKLNIEQPFDKFHIYAMEWTEDFICFYLDGKLVYRYQPEFKNDANWPFDKPAYFIFNIAIGGTWGGEVDNSIFPTIMTVDWVRVYQRKANIVYN